MAQTIFKAGNSPVVSIPSELFKEMNLKIGQEVVIEKIPNTNDFVVLTNPSKKKTNKNGVSKEFRQWLEHFIKEDKELLIELSHR